MSIRCKISSVQEYEPSILVSIIHDAFSDLLARGIVTLGSRITDDSLLRVSESSVIIVANDNDNHGRIAGVLLLSGCSDGHIEIIAVPPEYQRNGVGKQLLHLAEDIVIDRGGTVLWSDTGIANHASIQWHLNNGFKRSSLCSYSSTDYYSIEFRKNLKPRRMDKSRCALHFILSCLITPVKYGPERRPEKKLSLREIQQESLLILKKVHDFCIQNNIRYSLGYGSLIGAVRHKGFIPWDDDIDIIMPRPDYERFLDTFHSDNLGLFSHHSPDSYVLFSRVYDYSKTMIDTRFPFARNYKGGLWIDIFPADAVEDDYSAFKRKVAVLKNLYQKQMYYRDPRASFASMPTLKKKLGLLKRKLIRKNGKPLFKNNESMDKMIQSVPWGTTKHWSQMACMEEGEKMYQPIEDFDSLILFPFEDKQFLVFKNYDQELRRIYGDYMQLPPLEDRSPKQFYLDFYWIP